MFHLFRGAKTDRELESLAERIASNVANNYKDAAQDYLRQFEARFGELQAQGKLNPRQTERYGALLSEFKGKMKEFTHKDQKPYWT